MLWGPAGSIPYTYCKMQRKGDLKELAQFIREESVIERQFIGAKHLCFASKARFIICSSLKVN